MEMATGKNYGNTEIELFHIFADKLWNAGLHYEYTLYTCFWGSTPVFMKGGN